MQDMLWALVKCFGCRSNHSLSKGKTWADKNEVYYNKGYEKLMHDLDVVNLVEMIKGYRVMKQVLFDRN